MGVAPGIAAMEDFAEFVGAKEVAHTSRVLSIWKASLH